MTELKDKAMELLEPFERKHYSTLSDLHWIEQDDDSTIDSDYCENCVKAALKTARKSHTEQKAKILSKYKEIQETGLFKGKEISSKFSPVEIKKSKRYELKELGRSKFSPCCSYGGGYESDDFKACETCGRELNVSILPNEQVLNYMLEDLEGGEIDNQYGYRAYWLLNNSWDEEDENYKVETELTIKLAKRVIEILEKE